MKTNIAMKICDLLNVGGSYSEIVVADYERNTILLGHDGPFHIAISNQKPILRSVGVYHGKRGAGISVEAKVKAGPITTLGLTQKSDGKYKFIITDNCDQRCKHCYLFAEGCMNWAALSISCPWTDCRNFMII